MTKLTDNNVKTAAAQYKPKTSAVPPIAIMALGEAMQTGADKYGIFNWRETTVSATVFYDAMMRHLQAWYSGEDFAEDTRVHHLAHVMAGAAIVIDSIHNETFNDDRGPGQAVNEHARSVYKEPPEELAPIRRRR